MCEKGLRFYCSPLPVLLLPPRLVWGAAARGRVSLGCFCPVVPCWRCVVAAVPFFSSLIGLFLCACGVAFGLASSFIFASGFLFACAAVCSLLARLGY